MKIVAVTNRESGKCFTVCIVKEIALTGQLDQHRCLAFA
jgi:hypothetical protein